MKFETNSLKTKTRINFDEYIGRKSNKLTVIGYTDPSLKGRVKLKCLCDCGNVTYVFPYQFDKDKIQSCGCILKSKWKEHHKTPWIKHGYSHDRLYKKYLSMCQRCYNPNAKNYGRYGAKGVTVCDEWLNNPAKFVEWAIENGGLDESLSIDRIDNSGSYSPENCRFATIKEQQRNLKTNKIIEYNGESHCMAEWAEILGINYGTLSNRFKKGWSVERAFTEPIHSECRHKS